jgi:hypothetical protein
MATFDDLMTQLTTLTKAVQDNHGTVGLDKDALVADLKSILVEQQRLNLENAPVRSGEFQSDTVNRAADAYQGKYRRELKSIAKDGVYRVGGWSMKATDLMLTKTLIDSAWRMKQSGITFPGSDAMKAPASEDLNLAIKALTATGTGYGDELVPTGMASEMWNDFFLASKLVNDLPSIPMPTDPFDITLGFGARTWRKGTQLIAGQAADLSTSKVTLTATEQLTEDDWSYSLDEDSVIAMMPALRQNLLMTGGEQMDAFFLNADATATTSNINYHDGTTPQDGYWLSNGQDGLRHYCLVDDTGQGNSASGAAVSDALMGTNLVDLGKYQLDLANLRITCDPATYVGLLGCTNVATVDKYGPAATIVTGELARYRGIPILPSASMSKTAADGFVDGDTPGNNIYGQLIAYNRNMWRVGFRRGLTIEVDRLIRNRTLIMVTSFRIAVAAHGLRTSASDGHSACMYYILV